LDLFWIGMAAGISLTVLALMLIEEIE